MVYAHETTEEEFDMHKGEQEDYPLGTEFSDIEYLLLEWDPAAASKMTELDSFWNTLSPGSPITDAPTIVIDETTYAIFEMPAAWTVPSNFEAKNGGSGTDIEIAIYGLDIEGLADLQSLPEERSTIEKFFAGEIWDPLSGPVGWIGENVGEPFLDYYSGTAAGKLDDYIGEKVLYPVAYHTSNLLLPGAWWEEHTPIPMNIQESVSPWAAEWTAYPGTKLTEWATDPNTNQTFDIVLFAPAIFTGGGTSLLGKLGPKLAKIPGATKLFNTADDAYRAIKAAAGYKTVATSAKSKLLGNLDRYPAGTSIAGKKVGGQFAKPGTVTGLKKDFDRFGRPNLRTTSATAATVTPAGSTQMLTRQALIETGSEAALPGSSIITGTMYRETVAQPVSMFATEKLIWQAVKTRKLPKLKDIVISTLLPHKKTRAKLVGGSSEMRRDRNSMLEATMTPDLIDIPYLVEDTVTPTTETASEEPVDPPVTDSTVTDGLGLAKEKDNYYGKKKESQLVWQF